MTSGGDLRERDGPELPSRRALHDGAAVAAGALLAANLLHVRDSHALKPDILLSLAVVVALAAMLPLARHASVRSGMLAGAAVGAAVAAKYPGVTLFVPLYAASVLGSSHRDWRRCFPAAVIWAGLAAAAVFLATSPFVIFDPESRDALESIVRLALAPLWAGSPEVPSQVTPTLGGSGPGEANWLEGLLYHTRFSLRYGAGLLPALLAPIALVWGLASRRVLPLLSALFALVYFLVLALSGAAGLFTRYLTPIMPVLALLEAGMLTALIGRLFERRRSLILSMAILMLAAEPLASSLGHNRIASMTDTRVLATRWLDDNLPRGSRLLSVGAMSWSWGRPRMPHGVRNVSVAPTAEEMSEADIRYLLTHEHELFSSTLDPEVIKALAPRLQLLVEFDPASPARSNAVFEPTDAYYIPLHGFRGVTRPGPHIRIYAFE